MAFTDEQKLIVALLTEIHSKLEIQDGLDPKFVQAMVSSDETWALRWKYPGMFPNEETPPEVKRVTQVLDMWEVLERSAQTFSAEECAQVNAACAPYRVENTRFSGYSGNDEDEFSIVHILVGDLGRWTTFRDRDLNSHIPMVDVYDRMFAVYSRLNPYENFEPTLSVDDFAAVLRAQIHPDSR